MTNESSTRRLGDLLSLLIDHRGRTPKKLGGDFVSDGIPVVSALNVKEGRLNLDSDVRYVTREMYDRWMPQKIQSGDVLLTSEAPLGEAAYVREDIELCTGQRLYALRADSSQLDPRFLYYKLRTDSVRQRLQSRATGTTAQGIRQSELVEIPIEVPPMRVQRTVVHVLGVIDDLIDNNRRRIQILEEMARAIYREWFVHFRFPGHEEVEMVDSEMGEIPEGWKVVRLREIASVNETSIKRNEQRDLIEYVDISSVSTGQIDKTVMLGLRDAPGRAKRIVKHGDTIWSTVRPNRKSYCLVLHPPNNMIVSTGFAVITPKQVPYTYAYQALTTDQFVGYLTNHATGSAYPAVIAADFENAEVLLPDNGTLESYSSLTQNPYELKNNLSRQNRILGTARDFLIPRLVSGQLDVSNLKAELVDSSREISKREGQSTLDAWTDGDDQDADMGR